MTIYDSSSFWETAIWKKLKQLFPVKILAIIYWKLLVVPKTVSTFVACQRVSLLAKLPLSKKHINSDYPIYISLTTFPKRIDAVYYTICSLLIQKKHADKIILVLAKEEFPKGVNSLPKRLQSLLKKHIEILWCDENLKPHNKYYYAMKKYPQAYIITVDDDIIYPRNLVQNLFFHTNKHPNSVITNGSLQISIRNNTIDSFKKWKSNNVNSHYKINPNLANTPRFDLVAEGYSGILYPPSILPPETFNKEKIKSLAITIDDLWLKTMELLADIPVVCIQKKHGSHIIYFSQNIGLYKDNIEGGKNDILFSKLIQHYKEFNLLEKTKALNA
ncbi:MAG: hypothetical protein HUJ68_00555 [Clostridia bacterium]|nr:hypothetical protein [Clostridia bacterium]